MPHQTLLSVVTGKNDSIIYTWNHKEQAFGHDLNCFELSCSSLILNTDFVGIAMDFSLSTWLIDIFFHVFL